MPEETQPNSGSGESAQAAPVSTSAARKPKTKPPRLLPPWKVLLHNDDKNVFEDVIRIVRRLTPLSKQEAFTCVLEAHETGSALLLVTNQERAELYVEQFASCGLTVTAEPDT